MLTNTVILNSYRRPYNLKEQVRAIRNQTVEPTEIWLWVNYHEENKEYTDKDYLDYGVDKVVRSNHNFKYHGRFALSLLCQTTCVSFFDDDTIPGSKWIENCISSFNSKPGLYGGAGVVLLSREYMHHVRVGWPSKNADIQEVDLVGHAWFLPRSYLSLFWLEVPAGMDNGEDIQLSYTLQKYGKIKTYCPPHPQDQPELFSSLRPFELGDDEKASSNGSIMPYPLFCSQRNLCVQKALEGGWRTINAI